MTNTIQTCRCGERYVFRPYEKSGKLAPITVDPDPNGNVAILPDGKWRLIGKGEAFEGERFLNHFANCPSAGSFRR